MQFLMIGSQAVDGGGRNLLTLILVAKCVTNSNSKDGMQLAAHQHQVQSIYQCFLSGMEHLCRTCSTTVLANRGQSTLELTNTKMKQKIIVIMDSAAYHQRADSIVRLLLLRCSIYFSSFELQFSNDVIQSSTTSSTVARTAAAIQ